MTDATEFAVGPMAGIRVLDTSNVLAGPIASQMLGDFGADVIKVEDPRHGDSVRGNDLHKNGESLWWRFVARNKSTIAVKLSDPRGADIIRSLASRVDVLIENFRPGTFEKWGLDPEDLLRENPRLIVARISGFGQSGPYAQRRAFGTLIECMSGFAYMNGHADRPPTLPPFGLADNLAGLNTAIAVLMALHERTTSGRGQVIDISLLQPMMAALGPYLLWYDQLGVVTERQGNRTDATAPRGLYRCADDRWIGFSASSDIIAKRIMHMIDRADLVDEPWFQGGGGRAEHSDILDDALSSWAAGRTRSQALEQATSAQVPAAPVFDARDIFDDRHIRETEMVIELDDDSLGTLTMQNVPFRMSRTPGAVRFPGRPMGADTTEILTEEIGMSSADLDKLRTDRIVI